ncbi:MAG: glycosyltransferase family 39 protein [Hyphomicrobiales bacterium]|nr:glycosyltransferase family 39 protein [Hyphomicrobiales bacterium]
MMRNAGRTDETITRLTISVIGAALALRFLLAALVGLGTDEIYTVAVARQLSWSYFDHPPLHQWLAHVSALAFGEGRAVRLPFIILFAGTSWLLFLLTRRLYSASAGFWAVVTLNLAGFFTLSAGSWVVPDGPLLFMLALAAFALGRQFFPMAQESPAPLANWLLAGAALGGAGLAKYHAALVAVGLALFLLSTPRGRAELSRPAVWIAAGLAALLVSPVLFWNASNGWVSFLFQAGRSQGAGFAPWLAPLSLLAQAGWILPWVFAPLATGLWRAFRNPRDQRFWFLMALGLPTITVFTLLPMFGNLGLPHWAMPGWFFVMPLAGLYLSRLAETSERPRRWAQVSAIGSMLVLLLIGSQAATGWLGQIIPGVARNDPTIEVFGWDQLDPQLQAAGLLDGGRFIVADSWQNAGRIDVALAGRVIVIPGTRDPRHYAFLVDQSRLLGRDAVLIVRVRREAQMRETFKDHFGSLGPSVPVALGRGGLKEIDLVAIPATNFTKPLPWAYGRAR